MRWPNAVNATKARRRTHRTTGVAAQGEIDQPAGDGSRRTAGRAAGNASRRVNVDRCAIVSVFPGQAKSQLVAVCLPHKIRSSIKQDLHGWRHPRCRAVRGQPVRAAKTGLVADDVIDILDAENQVCQRADARAFRSDMSVSAEGSKIVVINY